MTPDEAVKRYTEIDLIVTQLEDEKRAIKHDLAAALNVGSHVVAGVKVTVSPPARKFNLDRAAGFLTPEQTVLATVTMLDAKKVKSFLPPVLLDEAMDSGTGDPVVRISA